ncbi:HECT-domain (ubiquitin-transferase) [Rhizoctonia solani]|uniref:E3 ubiquitin-protein ligase n=1 Tax=Rhizoctonia solani TaxID=456999 RepID=A0A8H8P854_9AGAM|nr:HECT-domain (ubiquitin-transferase) [Rhizoctonia solani]QRW27304.1 HECT-domain (ubiquitin-transferase) [Rhizoctonia solani]
MLNIPGSDLTKKIRITVVAADGLAKREVFRLPDPFAVITVDSEQTHTTSVIKKTLNPYWNENFDVTVKDSSVVAIQVFDQRKFKRRDQGFLGVVNIGSARLLISSSVVMMLTLELKKSNDNLVVHGKLIVYISTNTSSPITNPGPTHVPGVTGQLSGLTLHPSPSQPSIAHSSTPSTNAQSEGNNAMISMPTPNPAPAPELARQPSIASPRTAVDPLNPVQPSGPNFSSTEDNMGQLPQGWERRQDHLGRTYYVDHNTRTTTWNRPSSNAEANRNETRQEADGARDRHNRRILADDLLDTGATGATTPSGTGQGALNAGSGANPPPVLNASGQQTTAGSPYYVDHNTRTTTWVDPRRQTLVPWATPVRMGNASHLTARVYFVDHNTKTTTWDDPRLPSTLDAGVPQYKRDFRRKLIYFRSQPALRAQPGNCQIKVRRNHIFEDSYAEIMRQTPSDLKKRLMIKFDGEDGLDYGGLSREFFFLLSHEMFNPFYCFGVNPEHLNYFKFIGRCVGLGIFHRRFLDAYFIVSFYKMILKKKITLADLESVDAELHRGMTWMLENDITDVIDETFTTVEERFGELVTIELRPGGADVEVTEENKKEYVDRNRIPYPKARQGAFDAFMAGFSELIPQELINVFDERELELLIGGMSEIDVDDWTKYTDYRGYELNDEVIQWFWQCIRSWPPERKSRLLQFATGTSRIPVNGFKDLQGSDGPRRFTIEKAGDPSQLPKSHTCFNRIDLPPYKDYKTLEQKLTMAVEETVGFGQE